MRAVTVGLTELNAREVIDVPFTLIRKEQLRSDEGTQFHRVLFGVYGRFVIGVDAKKSAPYLEPGLDAVNDARMPQAGQLSFDGKVRKGRDAVLVCDVWA